LKFAGLLKTDAMIALRRLPILLIAFAACIFSFILALPSEILDSGTLPKVSMAVVYSGQNDDVTDLFFNLIGEIDVVDTFYNTDIDNAMDLLDEGKVVAVMELPSNVLDNMMRREQSVIHIHARDPLIGGFVLSLTRQAINAINSMQDVAIDYYETTEAYLPDPDEFREANSAFDISCVNEVFRRLDYINVERTVQELSLQLLSLLLFLGVAVCSVFSAMIAARQFSSGYIRRLRMHGIGFFPMWASKLAVSEALSVGLCLLLSLPSEMLGVNYPLFPMALSAALMSLVLFPICIAFAVSGKSLAAPATVMLGCAGALLFALFAGGGFYPVYLMPASIRLFNPAWLAHLLSDRMLGGPAVPLNSIVLSLTLAAACTFYSLKRWRAALG
jgi:hypothetical protein